MPLTRRHCCVLWTVHKRLKVVTRAVNCRLCVWLSDDDLHDIQQSPARSKPRQINICIRLDISCACPYTHSFRDQQLARTAKLQLSGSSMTTLEQVQQTVTDAAAAVTNAVGDAANTVGEQLVSSNGR